MPNLPLPVQSISSQQEQAHLQRPSDFHLQSPLAIASMKLRRDRRPGFLPLRATSTRLDLDISRPRRERTFTAIESRDASDR